MLKLTRILFDMQVCWCSVVGGAQRLCISHKPVVCPRTEPELHSVCIDTMTRMGWKHVAHEWLVLPGKEDYGRGDLVFRRNRTDFVVEVKRRECKKVHEQARYYGSAWMLRHAPRNAVVLYGIWTCDSQEVLGVIRCKEEAKRLCKRRVCKKLCQPCI